MCRINGFRNRMSNLFTRMRRRGVTSAHAMYILLRTNSRLIIPIKARKIPIFGLLNV